ncbi:MAG TPA: transposase [Chthoniobacterales bacterium]|nr:transposase [Chthoniobacterales bacterium]
MKKYPQVPPWLHFLFPADPIFFVTACTYRRRPLLTTDAVHNAFMRFSQRAYDENGIAVGRYVIMPDHIHLFVCGPPDFELGRWMGILKQCLEKAAPATASPTGRRLQKPFWQRRFFDHVLRSEESYSQKWNYVRDNPVRAGFVTDADDWPYAGEIIVIDRV